jgi:hypothetical protein
MATAHVLIIASDNVITLSKLRDGISGAYPTDASVTLELLDGESPVEGAGAIALSHVEGTTGAGTQYRGVIPYSLPLKPRSYTARVLAVTSDGQRRFDIPCVARGA